MNTNNGACRVKHTGKQLIETSPYWHPLSNQETLSATWSNQLVTVTESKVHFLVGDGKQKEQKLLLFRLVLPIKNITLSRLDAALLSSDNQYIRYLVVFYMKSMWQTKMRKILRKTILNGTESNKGSFHLGSPPNCCLRSCQTDIYQRVILEICSLHSVSLICSPPWSHSLLHATSQTHTNLFTCPK